MGHCVYVYACTSIHVFFEIPRQKIAYTCFSEIPLHACASQKIAYLDKHHIRHKPRFTCSIGLQCSSSHLLSNLAFKVTAQDIPFTIHGPCAIVTTDIKKASNILFYVGMTIGKLIHPAGWIMGSVAGRIASAIDLHA